MNMKFRINDIHEIVHEINFACANKFWYFNICEQDKFHAHLLEFQH